MEWLPSVVWLALLILFAVIEAATVGLVSVWFAAGALVALISSFFLQNVWLQAAVFLAVSAVTLALVRPLAARFATPRQVPTNADRAIGAEGVVIRAIDNLAAAGAVKVLGNEWSARSADDSPIPAGETVTVERIEGVKLIVTPSHNRKE